MTAMQHDLEEINQKVRERDMIISKQMQEIEQLQAELNKFEEENGINQKPLKGGQYGEEANCWSTQNERSIAKNANQVEYSGIN